MALGLMKATLRFAQFLCGGGILLIGPFAGIFVAIVVFICSGTLVPGELMYLGSYTPPLSVAATGAALSVAITATLAYAHRKLGQAAASRTMRPN